MKKKVGIIGAGVSGLSAGIHALQAGFEVDIYEANGMAGGECTGWNRQSYHIDNCIHFLVGCNDGEKLNDLWKNLGVLDDAVKLYREPYFYCMEMDGVKLHLWRDLNRARMEFLNVAPEDEKELNLFFDSVKGAECIKPPCEMSPAHMNPLQFMKMAMGVMDAGQANKAYGKQTMAEFVERFKNPYVKAMFKNYYNSNFIALTFVTSYAFYTSNTVAIPEGGSTGMVKRMVTKFKSMGGNLYTGAKITAIHKTGNKIEHLETSSGEMVHADYFIWAADPWSLFYDLLSDQYMDPNLKYMYEHPKGYVATTGYQAAFGIQTDGTLNIPEGSVIFPCEPFDVAGQTHDFCGIRLYDYDQTLFPANKRVLQCNILQNSENYEYWKRLPRDVYESEKSRIAADLLERVERQYPQLQGKLVLLGTYTPTTFHRWCGAYQGGYMSFNALKGFKSRNVKSTINGISNLFLGSQWVQIGGGLPIAAAAGKFAVQQLCKK